MDYLDLNPRQIEILKYIKDTIKEKGYTPTVREICNAVHLSSTSTVHFHLKALEKKGYIKRDPLKSRAIELINGNDLTSPTDMEIAQIPVLGKISAGLPALAEENIEDYFPLPLNFLRSTGQSFILKVSGDSMIEAGIENGDLLIVAQAQTANNGEIIVALIDDEATVKTFYKENNRYRLQPENHTMDPIYTDHVEVIGKPIGLIRKL